MRTSKIAPAKISDPSSILLILSTLGSFGIHFYLTQQHILTKYTPLESGALCNISDFLNCGTSIISPYSEIAGIPLAIFGALMNLLIFFFAIKVLLAPYSSRAENNASVALTLSIISAITSVIMACISLFILKSLCPFCTAAYVLSFITLITCYRVIDHVSVRGFNTAALKPLAMALLFLGVASFATGKVILRKFTSPDMQEISQLIIERWSASPVQEIAPVEPLKFGPDNAKMTIIEYSDFLCPHCKMAYPKLHTFAKAKGDVQVIFQSYPLDGCDGPTESPGYRCQLAMASYCAQKSGKGWEAQDIIFKNQEDLADTSDISVAIGKISAGTGLSQESLQACLKEATTYETIKKQLELGKSLGIEGTPTLFINNKKFGAGVQIPILDAIHSKL